MSTNNYNTSTGHYDPTLVQFISQQPRNNTSPPSPPINSITNTGTIKPTKLTTPRIISVRNISNSNQSNKNTIAPSSQETTSKPVAIDDENHNIPPKNNHAPAGSFKVKLCHWFQLDRCKGCQKKRVHAKVPTGFCPKNLIHECIDSNCELTHAECYMFKDSNEIQIVPIEKQKEKKQSTSSSTTTPPPSSGSVERTISLATSMPSSEHYQHRVLCSYFDKGVECDNKCQHQRTSQHAYVPDGCCPNYLFYTNCNDASCKLKHVCCYVPNTSKTTDNNNIIWYEPTREEHHFGGEKKQSRIVSFEDSQPSSSDYATRLLCRYFDQVKCFGTQCPQRQHVLVPIDCCQQYLYKGHCENVWCRLKHVKCYVKKKSSYKSTDVLWYQPKE